MSESQSSRFKATHLIFAVILFGIGFLAGYRGSSKTSGYLASLAPGSFRLSSPAFADYSQMPAVYTCEGKNMNPPLHSEKTPEGTKSFALTVDDTDTVGGSRLHWELWNIPADTKSIPENFSAGAALEGMTDFGNTKYNGPCFLAGQVHHYAFHLYALDNNVQSLPSGSERAFVSHDITLHKLADAELTGIYTHP